MLLKNRALILLLGINVRPLNITSFFIINQVMQLPVGFIRGEDQLYICPGEVGRHGEESRYTIQEGECVEFPTMAVIEFNKFSAFM